MHRTLTYFGSIFNKIIMKILDVGTWYELFGLNCQKEKIYRYLWVVFLILWTLLGLGRDTHTHSLSLSLSMQRYCALKLQLFKLKFMLVLVLVLVWWINWRKFVVVWTSKQFRVDCVPYLEFHFCIQLIKGIIFFMWDWGLYNDFSKLQRIFFPLVVLLEKRGKKEGNWVLNTSF